MTSRHCDVCRVEYEAKLPTSRYCSDRCRQRRHRGGPASVIGARGGATAAPVSQLTPEAAPGPVEARLAADLSRLVTAHPMGEALAAMSVHLARVLDAGAGLTLAAVTRELRANLLELARFQVDDDDLDDELSTPSGGTDDP